MCRFWRLQTLALAVVLGLAGQPITTPRAQQASSSDTYLKGSTQIDQQNSVVEQLEVSNGAISVRHDATDGLGAPQIGLDPTYPTSTAAWNIVKTRHPDAAARYQPCVDDYTNAITEVKQIAPLTKRPAWDVSGPQINAALQRASADVSAGDQCTSGLAKNPGNQQANEPPSPTRAPPPDYGPMQIPVVTPAVPPLQGNVQETAPAPSPTLPPFNLGTGVNVPAPQIPPPSYQYPYPSPSGPGINPQPAPTSSPIAQPIRPQYAYTSVTYLLNGVQGRQDICITRTNNATGAGQINLSAVRGTQYQYFVKAVGTVSANSIRITGLIDVSGGNHPVNLTIPFMPTPCSL